MGAAYAAGEVLRGHVDVAVRTHRDLGEKIREELIPLEQDGSGCVRRIQAVDALLAEKSRAWSVRELDRFARALVEELNPKTPAGAHERRFLYASPDANGNLVGKFACGATHGALILAVLAAGNGLDPVWRSTRTASNACCRTPGIWGSGTSDALTDCLAAGAARAGITLPPGAGTRPDPNPGPTPSVNRTKGTTTMATRPEAEGEYTVVREPGVLSGPYPPVKILVTVGVEHSLPPRRTAAPTKDLERRVELQ